MQAKKIEDPGGPVLPVIGTALQSDYGMVRYKGRGWIMYCRVY